MKFIDAICLIPCTTHALIVLIGIWPSNAKQAVMFHNMQEDDPEWTETQCVAAARLLQAVSEIPEVYRLIPQVCYLSSLLGIMTADAWGSNAPLQCC